METAKAKRDHTLSLDASRGRESPMGAEKGQPVSKNEEDSGLKRKVT